MVRLWEFLFVAPVLNLQSKFSKNTKTAAKKEKLLQKYNNSKYKKNAVNLYLVLPEVYDKLQMKKKLYESRWKITVSIMKFFHVLVFFKSFFYYFYSPDF